MTAFPCASCGAPVARTFIDFGQMPSANAFLTKADLDRPTPRWPLRAAVCEKCFLVQLDYHVEPERLFSSYVYFSSYADSWVDHARKFAQATIQRFTLGPSSRVIEVGSNDGYMLRHFKDADVPVLGIEPAANVAEVSRALGIETRVQFFGRAVAECLVQDGWSADLVIANNVLAHVPQINDFVAGLSTVLKPQGVLSVEYPHLLELIEHVEFDTIYHEHFFYYSLLALEPLFAHHGLTVFDAEQLPTHGGSLRIYASRTDGLARMPSRRLARLRNLEKSRALDRIDTYAGFEKRAKACRDAARTFFADCRLQGRRIAGYGAAAKGNTFLNYCGCGPDNLLFVADRNPVKQSLYLPGSQIPVRAPEAIFETKPDYVVILPWNLQAEIMKNLAGIREWGGQFVRMVPYVEVM